MSRQSNNEVDTNGFIKHGFDYKLQVWVTDHIIQDMQIARELNLVGKDNRKILT